MKPLKILDMSVTWRNILDLGTLSLSKFQGKKNLEKKLVNSKIIPSFTPEFQFLNKVTRTVCSLISSSNIFLPLFSFKIASIPRLHMLSTEEILGQIEQVKWQDVNCYALIHKSGIAMIKYMTHFSEEQSTKTAIHSVRMGIKNLLIQAPLLYDPENSENPENPLPKLLQKNENNLLFMGNLKDFSSSILRSYLRKKLTGENIKKDFGEIRFNRCISNTMIEVYKTSPECASINEFTSLNHYGRELRGIGSMDLAYQNRADQLIQSTFEKDFSDDEELSLYLMGLSDFLIYNNKCNEMLLEEQKRLKLESEYEVKKYIAYHYEALMDWVYMEQFIIRMYDTLLSKSMARDSIRPQEMLSLQKSSMQNLIEYAEGITPYTTRANILEEARIMYRLPEEQERLEKKRDGVTEYVMQEYSLRTNRGIQLLNFIISATISFELMQLVLQIAESPHSTFWAGASSGIFILLVGFFYFFYIRLLAK